MRKVMIRTTLFQLRLPSFACAGASVRTLIFSSALLGLAVACAAVYPEMQTAVRAAPEGTLAEPPPEEDLYFVFFDGAWIPPKDRGGRQWESDGPDPFAKLIVDDVERIVTPVQANTREPNWPKQDKENLRIRAGAKIFVEVWDDNPVTDHPICRAKVRNIDSLREGGENEIWCDSGARVRLHVESAKPLLGIGLYYETRGRGGVRVTRVVSNSPAARAGLSTGDRILAVQGKPVTAMDALEVRSAINLHSRTGLKLDVWFQNGKRHVIELKEGSLYPTAEDDLKLQQ
jgi:membrane-associated protease RseP (regulator of RpoE activity)